MLYTGGPRPYGYEGLGEVFVFTFFGLVAVVGSYYVQTEELSLLAFALAVPVGLLAAAILMVNNIRDVDTDRRAGKRTLAVRLGRRARDRLFDATLAVAFGWTLGVAIAEAASRWLALPLLAAPLVAAAGPHRRDAHRRAGAERRAGAHRDAARALLGPAVRRPAAGVLMKIERLEVVPYALPFREPYVTARGRLERREMVLVRRTRTAWWGSARRRHWRCAVAGPWPRSWPSWRPAKTRMRRKGSLCRRASRSIWPSWDLRGKVAGRPLCELLGAAPAAVECNATLVAGEPAAVAESAREWSAHGFRTFKLKVGVDGDERQVQAVRDALPGEALIRVDANAVWSVDEAARKLEQMAPLELAEQPVAGARGDGGAAHSHGRRSWSRTRAS